MKRISLHIAITSLTFIIGISFAIVWTAYRFSTSSKNEVLKLTNTLHDALALKDIEVIDHILADDITVTRVDDSIIDKADWISIIKNSEFTIDSIITDDIHVEISGDKAQVNGNITMVAHFPDYKSVDHHSRFTYMYEKRRGVWQIVSIRSQKQ